MPFSAKSKSCLRKRKGFGYESKRDRRKPEMPINSPVDGKVKEWRVDEGARVRTDELLAVIDQA